MPRESRWIVPGIPVHVVQRGIDRNACFFSEPDYLTYLFFLRSAARRYACAVHAYCLMTNHVHLLLTPHEPESCGEFMKRVGQGYVQAINKRLGRTGTLWEGRFRSCLVQSDLHVLACYRYIELNPVRSGMVASPSQYRWSSYATNAQGKPEGFLRPHPAYESLGESAERRASAYAALCAEALPANDIEEIRRATRVGCVVGARRKGPGRPRAAK